MFSLLRGVDDGGDNPVTINSGRAATVAERSRCVLLDGVMFSRVEPRAALIAADVRAGSTSAFGGANVVRPGISVSLPKELESGAVDLECCRGLSASR